MSAIFSAAALLFDHTPEELADLDRHDDVRRPRPVLPPVQLTELQCAAVDDTAGIEPEPAMKNTLIRAAFVASQRRFDSTWGGLPT